MPASTIDEYIAGFPEDVQARLTTIRETVQRLAPEATESISYQIPTFKIDGKYLVYFAGFKDHVSLYPIPDGPEDFEALIQPYRVSKGTLRFVHKQPLPMDVIERVVLQHLAARRAKTQRARPGAGRYNKQLRNN